MKLIDFKEKKSEKDGTVTTESLVKSLLKEIEDGKIQRVLYIALDKNGYYITGHSETNNSTLIGDIEIGKQLIMDEMREYE